MLIEGAAGSGKSTLSAHICMQWSEGNLFTEYRLVVLVQLRDPEIHSVKSIADLLPAEEGQTEVANEACKWISSNHGKGVLFILDGWDELPTSLKKDSIFVKLVHGKASHNISFLHLSDVLVTSRPVSSGDLHSVVSTRIELLGFTEDELQQYFCDCFQENDKAVQTLLNTIRNNPGLCYLPLNASIFVHLFKCEKNLPNTRYGTIHELVLSCIYRHLIERLHYELSLIHI